MHGNVVLIKSRTTLAAEGDVYTCAEAAPAPAAAPVAQTPPAAGGGAEPAPVAGAIEEKSLDSRARELFVLGREAYLQQRFDEALRYFNAAYELSGRYELQYNVGQAADKLHRNQEALAAFERFLQSAPPSPLRSETESRVGSLRAERSN